MDPCTSTSALKMTYSLSRAPYTRKEQIKILSYIVEKRAFEDLKGRNFWQKMEMDKVSVVPRSWQSLKEHFKKQIMPQINSFQLDPRVVSMIKRGFKGETVNCHDIEDLIVNVNDSNVSAIQGSHVIAVRESDVLRGPHVIGVIDSNVICGKDSDVIPVKKHSVIKDSNVNAIEESNVNTVRESNIIRGPNVVGVKDSNVIGGKESVVNAVEDSDINLVKDSNVILVKEPSVITGNESDLKTVDEGDIEINSSAKESLVTVREGDDTGDLPLTVDVDQIKEESLALDASGIFDSSDGDQSENLLDEVSSQKSVLISSYDQVLENWMKLSDDEKIQRKDENFNAHLLSAKVVLRDVLQERRNSGKKVNEAIVISKYFEKDPQAGSEILGDKVLDKGNVENDRKRVGNNSEIDDQPRMKSARVILRNFAKETKSSKEFRQDLGPRESSKDDDLLSVEETLHVINHDDFFIPRKFVNFDDENYQSVEAQWGSEIHEPLTPSQKSSSDDRVNSSAMEDLLIDDQSSDKSSGIPEKVTDKSEVEEAPEKEKNDLPNESKKRPCSRPNEQDRDELKKRDDPYEFEEDDEDSKEKPLEKSDVVISEESTDDSIRCEELDSTKSGSRHPYTDEDDMRIAIHISDKNLFKHYKGNALWIKLAKEKLLPGRSWQSMKNRFVKKILPNLGEKFFDVKEDVESGFETGAFTEKEDVAILKYISKTKRYSDTRGVGLWKDMEMHGICRPRTWQSLKERYRKRILRDLKKYNLPQEIKDKYQ